MSEQMQICLITLRDGRVLKYTGPVQVDTMAEAPHVTRVQITTPVELPDDVKLEVVA